MAAPRRDLVARRRDLVAPRRDLVAPRRDLGAPRRDLVAPKRVVSIGESRRATRSGTLSAVYFPLFIASLLLFAFMNLRHSHSMAKHRVRVIDWNGDLRKLGGKRRARRWGKAAVDAEADADSQEAFDDDIKDLGEKKIGKPNLVSNGVEIDNLWLGRPGARGNTTTLQDFPIHGVLSHCRGELSWLPAYLSSIPFKTFTVVSKCGVAPNMKYFPSGSRVLEVPSAGGSDHTAAYWMAHQMPKDPVFSQHGHDIILLLKDEMILEHNGRLRNVTELLNIAATEGFGCGFEPMGGKSFFHLTSMLTSFHKDDKSNDLALSNDEPENDSNAAFKSQFKNLGLWLADVEATLPRPLSPVCYEGVFAVKKSQIDKVPNKTLLNLERSLSRGDNIEEREFAERTWAGLFYRELSDRERHLLFSKSTSFSSLNDSMRGALVKA